MKTVTIHLEMSNKDYRALEKVAPGFGDSCVEDYLTNLIRFKLDMKKRRIIKPKPVPPMPPKSRIFGIGHNEEPSEPLDAR